MRVLLVKTSSMGDVIHTLPALTDAGIAIPGISFDWVVEPSFQEIPEWHPLVDRVIPMAIRKWRKNLLSAETRNAWAIAKQRMQERQYDLVLDAQGLVKSAVITYFAHGKRAGLDWPSAREALASLCYQNKHTVNFYQHAVVRMRQLFSAALDYPLPTTAADFGLEKSAFAINENAAPYVVLLHGTTWASKQWPEVYWRQLAERFIAAGFRVKIGGGNPQEVARAERLAQGLTQVDLVPYLTIGQMATLLAGAKGAIAVDTGFGHLAAALNLPTISIYGATNPGYTSAIGKQTLNLSPNFPCAPCLQRECTYREPSVVKPACYSKIPPDLVWQKAQLLGIV